MYILNTPGGRLECLTNISMKTHAYETFVGNIYTLFTNLVCSNEIIASSAEYLYSFVYSAWLKLWGNFF